MVLMLLGLSLFTVQAQSVETEIVGKIDNTTPFREYPLRVSTTGSTITIDMRPLEGERGGDLDTLLYLVDENGSIVGENDDRIPNQDSSSLLVYPQAVAGQYRIIATRFKTDRGNSSGEFRILINIEQPRPRAEFGVRLGDLLNTGFPISFTPREKADWTVLVYYGGDNNLEPGIMQDFREFELGGGSDDTVRVLAMLDRTPAPYSVADGDWSNTRIYEVSAAINDDGQLELPVFEDLDGRDANLFLSSRPLVEFDPLNTGDGEILAQFLVWGVTNFPADNYIIAFGSHGAGWGGIVTDDSAPLPDGKTKNILTLPELDRAFALAMQAAGGDKFALLINDACLMGSAEYFATIAPYFRYTIASPEIVVNPALDMQMLLEGLRENPQGVDIVQLSKDLIDRYIDVDVPQRQTSDIVYMTNAIIDLSEFSPVVSAIENFARVVNRNPNVRGLTLGEARSNVYVYTSFMGGKDSIDLGDLMRRIIANARDDEMIAAAERVLNTLNKAYVYGSSGERAARFTSYFNVYFPEKSSEFKFAYFDETPMKEWSRMLRNYFNSFTPQVWRGRSGAITFHTPAVPEISVIYVKEGETSVLERPQVTVEVRARNISEGRATFDRILKDGTTVRLGLEPILTPVSVDGEIERINRWEEGVSIVPIIWDARLPVLSDGVNSATELINVTERVAFLDGRYREPNTEEWNEVTVSFDLEGRRGGISRVQRVINRGQNSSAVAVIDIPIGSEFQTYRNIVTPDGRVVLEPNNVYIWSQDGLTWQSQPAPSGVYNIGLQVSAFGGTIGNAEAQVTVNNDGISPLLSAYSEPFLGFNVPLPATWDTMIYTPQDYYRASSPDQRQNLSVYFDLTFASTTLEEALENVAASYGLTLTSAGTPTVVANRDVLESTYTYEAGGRVFEGRMIVLFDGGIGYGFGVEYVGADNVEYYNQVKQLLSFTDLNEVQNQTRSSWRRERLNDNVEFFVPLTWQRMEQDGWTMFQPIDGTPAIMGTRVVELASTVQGVDSVVNNIVTGFITLNAESILITGNQIYYLKAPKGVEPVAYDLDWRATLYEGVRNGVEVVGRVYAGQQDGKTYAVWLEAPKGETAAALFPAIFEPMLESYRIYPIEQSASASS
jgi:hypothetical protein